MTSPRIDLRLADCREILRSLPPCSVHVATGMTVNPNRMRQIADDYLRRTGKAK